MKKLIGLVVGLMVSVSVFADVGDRINKAWNQISDKMNNIIEDCAGNTKEIEKLNEAIDYYNNALVDFLILAFDETADELERGVMIATDDYAYAQSDGYEIEIEINDNVLIIAITKPQLLSADLFTVCTINANGEFSASSKIIER